MTHDVALWRRVARVIGFIPLGFLLSRAIYPIVWRSQWLRRRRTKGE